MSLPAEDVEFLDQYAAKHQLKSRSAALNQAIRVLRMEDLRAAYAEAWQDWDQSPDAKLWDSTSGDGV